jgi:hypothetical protein
MTISSADIAKALRNSARVDNDRLTMSLGVVTALSGTNNSKVEYIPQAIYGSELDTGASMMARQRVGGPSLKVGDVIVVLKLDKDAYVLGLAGGDGVMRIEWGGVPMGSGKRFGALDFDATDFGLIQEDAAGIDTDVDEVNVALNPIITDAKRGIYNYVADGTPVTATNNSTSTYATLASFSVVLPAGTWQYNGTATMIARNNTAGSGGTLRFGAPTASGGNFESSPTANAPFTVIKTQFLEGLSGTVGFVLEYRVSSSGTVTPSRWAVDMLFQRTA